MSDNAWTDAERAFLIGLEKLSRETGVVVGGCGCCGSPYLFEEADMSKGAGYGWTSGGDVTWISPSDKYYWERYRQNIARKQ